MQEARSGASQTGEGTTPGRKKNPGATAPGGIRRGTVPAGKRRRRGTPPHRKRQTAAMQVHCRSRFSCVKAAGTPYLQSPTVSAGFSRYPDLRFISTIRPSQKSPMAGFRRVWCLRAYSGGTVRDFHPIPYCPGRPHGGPGTEPAIYFPAYHTTESAHCQG